MRARLFLFGITLLLAALAWVLVRARENRGEVDAALTRELACGAQGVPLDAEPGGSPRPAQSARRAGASGPRFEPLPEDPTELVVHVQDDATEERVAGAEVFVLEVDESDWPETGGPDRGPVLDIEAELRARGSRMESDEHGNLRLPVPGKRLVISAREDDRFGETIVGFDSCPEAILRIVRSGSCRVRVHGPAGLPVAGVEVVCGTDNYGFWRAPSDSAGEVLVPNLGWLIADRGSRLQSWFVAVDELAVQPVLQRYSMRSPLPETIDLALGESQQLRLRITAGDGTPVPIAGRIFPSAWLGGGSAASLHLPSHTSPCVALVHGEAIFPCVEPGAWLRLLFELGGSASFNAELRVPPLEQGIGDVQLALPESLQVVLAHLTDDSGAPLASSAVEWVSFAQASADEFQREQNQDHLCTDEQGLLLFVLSRDDLAPAEPDLDEEKPEPRLAWRGCLRTHGPGHELESAPLLYSTIPPGAVRDLGIVRLARAVPLARGQVRDDRGRPLAHVQVGVDQTRTVDGDVRRESLAGLDEYDGTQTDTEGAFALYGACAGGRLRLHLSRDGYAEPRDSTQCAFDCGESPDRPLTLVRTGAIQTSLRVNGVLRSDLTWVLEEGSWREEQRYFSCWADGELLEHSLSDLLPGTYKVSLVQYDEPPLLAIDDVIVRSGQRTLDPRLLEVDLRACLGSGTSPRAAIERPAPIVVRIVDGEGRSIRDGLLVRCGGCCRFQEEWHDGRIEFDGGRSSEYFTIWSPGFRPWCGTRPNSSGELQLEPSWRIRFHLEIPPEFRRPDLVFHMLPRVIAAKWSESEIGECMSCAELDAQGNVSFECPGECNLGFELVALLLDPNGSTLSRGESSCTLEEFSFDAVPELDSMELDVDQGKWAELRRLASGR